MMMALDRNPQTRVILNNEPARTLPGLELPGHLRAENAAVIRHIVAWPEFVEVWLRKALRANATGVVPTLASQLVTIHLAQLGRAIGAPKLALGPLHSAPAVALARTIAPGLEVVPRAVLKPKQAVEVTADLLEVTRRAGCGASYVHGADYGQRLLFRHGAPVRFAGAPCTLATVLAHLGVIRGFEALVDSQRRLEARSLSAEALAAKRALDAEWSRLVANGGWFHPRRRTLDHALRDIGRQLDGEVTLTPIPSADSRASICPPAAEGRQSVESPAAAY